MTPVSDAMFCRMNEIYFLVCCTGLCENLFDTEQENEIFKTNFYKSREFSKCFIKTNFSKFA